MNSATSPWPLYFNDRYQDEPSEIAGSFANETYPPPLRACSSGYPCIVTKTKMPSVAEGGTKSMAMEVRKIIAVPTLGSPISNP